MKITPVLVPDHTANDLRRLMDSFAEASTGSTRQELAESRSAVAEAYSGQPGFWSSPPESDIETFGLQKGRPYQINSPQDFKPGDKKRAKQQLIPTQDKKDHIRSRLGKHVAPALPESDVAEGLEKQLNIQQLATISDEALDNAYHYGRSTPGNTFGWQANLKSAAYAKQMIDRGVTDIEAISDAIHKGWNVTARAFVQNPEQFADTEKLRAAGKLEAKLQQRAKLMNIGYSQLPDDEQEKDRVVARALLQALKGPQGVTEIWSGKDDDDKVDAINAANPPKRSTPYTPPSTPAKHHTYDRSKAVASNISGKDSAAYDRFTGRDKEQGVTEGSDDSGAYDKWDPKHPDFVKNYRKFQARNPGATLKDFIADLKKGVTEAGRPDVMRHRGDTTVKVVKKAGKPIGEIGIDAEASEGNGSYYVKLYDGSYDAVGFDSAEEALAELKYAIKSMSEGTASGEVDEGLKQKLAGAALAGAMALGAGGAQAQSTDKYDPSWNAHSMTHHIGSDVSSTKSMNSADPSKDTNDFQRRIQKVSGPNAQGEYKVVVMQGHDIVSHYVTKTPPPEWLYKEDAESKTDEGMIDSIKNTVRAANYDRLARRSNSQAVAGGGLAPPAQFRALSTKGDQRAQKAQDIRKGDVAESVDPIEQLRADILRFSR